MTFYFRLFFCCLYLTTFFSVSSATLFFIQAEDHVNYGKFHRVLSRPNAWNSKTLFVPGGQEFVLRFCLTKDTKIAIKRVALQSDVPLIYDIDYKNVRAENCFNQSSCSVADRNVSLYAGQHFIKIANAKTSPRLDYEIDYVEVFVDDSSLQFDVFQCKVFCFDGLGRSKFQKKGNDKLPKSVVQNLSHRTTCAEVDNVRVPIFHSTARKIEVKATHPGYKTFLNFRGADWRNCKIDNKVLWRIENANLHNVLSYGEKFYIAKDDSDQKSFSVKFLLEGVEQDSADSEIGTVLSLRLANVQNDIGVKLSYYGRHRVWNDGGSQQYTTSTREVTWNIPDFTFSDKIENQISLAFSQVSDDMFIELLMLKKRNINADARFKMYQGNGIAIEGVHLDFWWLHNQTMSVRILETNKVYNTAHYVVVYVLKPWTKDEWAQVLVLYQDGNARMLPVTQEGVDWIPFGSSVIIGESDPTFKRPHAAISHVDFHVDALTLKLTYNNGNSMTVKVLPEFDSTTLILSDMNLMYKLPLVTFRSMYVKDGNCDVDHVIVDGDTEVGILSDWDVLSGSSVMFFRKCISRHNTQSPDISVYFIE